MHKLIEERREEIAEICRDHGVRRLEVFGSAARGTDFNPVSSDVDFLVTFETADGEPRLTRYFSLAEALEALLGQHVDLLEKGALENSPNHIRRRSVLADAQIVHG